MKEITNELSDVLYLRVWDGLVFCGFGEPTERLDVLIAVSKWVKQHYARRLEIRVDTNGHGFRLNAGRDVVSELKEAGVNIVSVSLNAADKETYNDICRPTFVEAFDTVLDFINRAKQKLIVEVSVVRLPEVDVAKVKAVADELDVRFKIREYIPCFF